MTAVASAVWGWERGREGEGEGERERGRDSLISVIHIITCQYRPSELVSILYSQLEVTLVEIGSVPSEQ